MSGNPVEIELRPWAGGWGSRVGGDEGLEQDEAVFAQFGLIHWKPMERKLPGAGNGLLVTAENMDLGGLISKQKHQNYQNFPPLISLN